MDRVKGVWKQARALVFRRTAEQELADELAFHVDMATAENQRRGMSAEEARRMALISFGGMERYAERVREGRWTRWIEDVATDLKYGVRMLARRPGFTAAVVATLALGIGGTTAIFSVVDGLFLRAPAGVADAESLRRVYIRRDEGGIRSPNGGPGSWLDFVSMREGASGFAAVGAMIGPMLRDVDRGEAAEQLRVAAVSHGFLEMLGVRPAVGRLFSAAEDEVIGAHPVGMISHRLWQTRFGGAPDVVGRTLLLNGETVEVIGVTQEGFEGISPDPVEVWLPSAMASRVGIMFGPWREKPDYSGIHFVARLAPGAADTTAAAQASATLRRVAEAHPALDPTPEVVTTELVPAAALGGSRAADLSLWLALVAGLVLVIACANVANLLMARAIARRRELAVRLSLGAGRWRVARQHLTESLLLALLGGAAGVLVTYWALGLMRQFPLPPSAGQLDGRLLLFALAVSLVAGLLFGVLPAVRAVQLDPVHGLRESRAVGATGRSRTRRALVVLQVSLSLVLLVGAGLFVRSLGEVNAIDGGVDVDRLLTVTADLGRVGFSADEREAFYEAALQRLESMPGVERAAIVHFPPFIGMSMSIKWQPPGRTPADDEPAPMINMAGPGYFGTAGTRLLSGREFGPADDSGEPVAVVNEALARLVAPDGDAVGRCVAFAAQVDDGGCTHIVGVVETQRHRILEDGQAPMLFLSRAQAPTAVAWGGPALVVRTAGDPEAYAPTVRAALQSLRSDLPFITVLPLSEQIGNDVLPFRLGAILFTMFGVLALVLAAVGLNGVLGYFVTERTHEIGIRRSLGAPARQVMVLVVRQGMVPVVAGVAIGLLAAVSGTRLLASLLFGVEARDPFVFAGAAVFLIVVALLAALVPARRAGRVSPMVALRQDG